MNRIELLHHFARLDLDRRERTGIPEAILASGKTLEHTIAITQTMASRNGRVLVTKIPSEWHVALQESLSATFRVQSHPIARMMVVHRQDAELPRTLGRIGILSAGTSDLPIAEEARIVAEEMGCATYCFHDVGVAGLHRLAEPLEQLLEHRVAAIVVVAGMEGALPTVVKGLVPVPIIGVPSSVGYGYGANGHTALMAMLQSCSPGLTVVNIDNGFGAGATAALIANQRSEK